MGVMPELPRHIAVRALVSDRAVCLARRDHAALNNGLTLKTFVSLPHVRAALTKDPIEDVDVALAHKGLERRFAMIVPSYLAVCAIVGNSTMLGVVPEQLARPIAAQTGIAIHEIPLDMTPWNLCVMWSKRSEKDPAICWLRDRIHATLSGLEEAGPAGAMLRHGS
jgi:DNA-binding transcriptional LysR family regulator